MIERKPERRPGEQGIDLPDSYDAGLYFIGRIATPWPTRSECPRNGAATDALCTIEVAERFAGGLADIQTATHLIVLYWMDEAARDLVVQRPRHWDVTRGTFSVRSPARPNPIALSVVELVRVDERVLTVRGLDCRDGTPLLDLKPYYALTDSRPDARVDRRSFQAQ
jgi:tRNA-Thr(GGU) m(6)t(6)A37 methyltransferase TsaA